MHVGLIGGIGPAATDAYYRGLIAASAARGRALEATIAHADAPTLIANLAAGAATAQAAIYARLTERLARAGADRVAVTSIGGHFCIEAFKPLSALPVIDIVDAVRDAVAARGARRVGLIGTRTVMESGFYGGLAPVETLAPPGALADAVHAAYVDMATSARVTAEQRAVFDEACAALLEAGADAVLLAGTDLALAYDAQTSDLPLIDGIAAHVAAILRA